MGSNLALQNTIDWFRRNRFFVFVCLVILSGLFAYRKFIPLGMIQFADVIPFPPTASEAFGKFFFAWVPLGLGYEAPMAPDFIIGIFVAIFRDPVIAQKIFYLAPLLLSAITMYLFVSRFTAYEPARYLASFIYAFNPIISYGGPPGPLAFPYIFYPLMALYLFKLFDEDSNFIKNGLLFSIFSALATFFSYYAVFLFSPVLLVIIILSLVKLKNPKIKLKKVLILVASLGLVFILALPFTLPSVWKIGQIETANQTEGYLKDIGVTYSDADLIRLIRLTGQTGPFDSFYGYKHFSIWGLAGYIIPLLVVIAIHRSRKNPSLTRPVLILALVALSVVAFTWATYQGWTIGLFKKWSFLLILRNPKQLAILALSFAFLAGIGYEAVIEKTRGMRRWLIGLAIPGLLLVFNWPFFTGDMGTSTMTEKYHVKLEVPKVSQLAGSWLSERRSKEGFFRTLWLPARADLITSLKWFDPAVFSIIPGSERVTEFEAVHERVDQTLQAICSGQFETASDFLSKMSVKYIIVDKTSNTSGNCRVENFFITGEPQKIIGILDQQETLGLVEDNQSFGVYKNKLSLPHLTISEGANIQVLESKPTFYKLIAEGQGQQTIILAEKYHPGWSATQDGKPLTHIKAFDFANGFEVSLNGRSEIKIEYTPQGSRQKIIYIWLVVWLITGLGLFVLLLKNSRNKLLRSINQSPAADT